MFKKALLLLVISVLILIGVLSKRTSENNSINLTNNVSSTDNLLLTTNQQVVSTPMIVAQNLAVPWEIAFLPNGEMLVTERLGKLLKVTNEPKTIQIIQGVKQIGEGGLLGLAIHPNYSANNYIYVYLTYQNSKEIKNKVDRYKLTDDTLTDGTTILDGIKGSSNHDGGRIAFGPDGYLYITTGDAEVPMSAQDKNSLNGKILRVKDDGTIPSDNPFNNAVYSLGHRNPQGLAWDEKGNLWETEHGPSGSQTGYDEVNIIYRGANYGWPLIKGEETKEGYQSPIVQSGSRDTWAPSGLAYFKGSLFFAGLRGEALYKAQIEKNNQLKLTTYFKKQYGRLRAVVLGPDNKLFMSTSNRDGRGTPKSEDDRILKLDPNYLDI